MILRMLFRALQTHKAIVEPKIPFSMLCIFLSVKLETRQSDTIKVLQFEGTFYVSCSIKSEKWENKGIIDAWNEKGDIETPASCSIPLWLRRSPFLLEVSFVYSEAL